MGQYTAQETKSQGFRGAQPGLVGITLITLDKVPNLSGFSLFCEMKYWIICPLRCSSMFKFLLFISSVRSTIPLGLTAYFIYTLKGIMGERKRLLD